jgi:hypothetical protein
MQDDAPRSTRRPPNPSRDHIGSDLPGFGRASLTRLTDTMSEAPISASLRAVSSQIVPHSGIFVTAH